MDDLETSPDPLAGVPGVRLEGELDLGNAAEVEARLDAAIRASDGAFLIDLCDVSFLDSTAVGLLLRARALLGREERQLVLVCPPGRVRRVFELAGVSDLFCMLATREEAAAVLVPR
jgi:anti-sigma B factor antagonist